MQLVEQGLAISLRVQLEMKSFLFITLSLANLPGLYDKRGIHVVSNKWVDARVRALCQKARESGRIGFG